MSLNSFSTDKLPNDDYLAHYTKNSPGLNDRKIQTINRLTELWKNTREQRYDKYHNTISYLHSHRSNTKTLVYDQYEKKQLKNKGLPQLTDI